MIEPFVSPAWLHEHRAEVVLADHPLLFAIPVLVPTFVVVAVIVAVVVRDRRRGEPDDAPFDRDDRE